MGTPREVGGYIWRQEVNRALQANKLARKKLTRILEDGLGRQRTVFLLAEISQQLGVELEALVELEKIGEEQAESRREKE